MPLDSLPAQDEEGAQVRRWETHLASHKTIPVEGQDELRTLLVKGVSSPSVKRRLIQLLNPRRSPTVVLSDEELNNQYDILHVDNYAPVRTRNIHEQTAVFDAAHGYYVALRIGLLS